MGDITTAKIGLIGMGNMGYAILKGLLHVYKKEEIIFTDVNHDRMEKVFKETGVSFVESNEECAGNAKYVVLAVKPQFYNPVLKDITGVVTKDNVIMSIAPGITIDSLKEKLGSDKRIVRAMPNTPALLGAGMTGVSYEAVLFSEEEKQRIKNFFESFGKMELMSEPLIDVAVCVSGSSPAYVYMFIEALADSAVKYGLPRDMAYRMASQTVMGSAMMVLETGEHPGKLKDQVCSPGGTAIAGVTTLEEYGFRNAVIKASDACYEKCGVLKQ